MNLDHIQEQMARLEKEHETAQKAFAKTMEGLATHNATIGEACEAFRKASTLQIDISEVRLRAIGDVISTVGLPGALSALNMNLPTIG
jgi:chromosome segregation ATPase